MATSDGRVIRAQAVHPRPETVRITKDLLNNIKVGPWNPSEVITQGSVGEPAQMKEETQPHRRGSLFLAASALRKNFFKRSIIPKDARNAVS